MNICETDHKKDFSFSRVILPVVAIVFYKVTWPSVFLFFWGIDYKYWYFTFCASKDLLQIFATDAWKQSQTQCLWLFSKMAILRKPGEETNMGCHVLISIGCLPKYRCPLQVPMGKMMLALWRRGWKAGSHWQAISLANYGRNCLLNDHFPAINRSWKWWIHQKPSNISQLSLLQSIWVGSNTVDWAHLEIDIYYS